LAVLLLAAPAAGQNNNDLNAFDFSLPGARSRGMGGAFVAIADDATAVYSNPAGLNMLFKPEVSFEGRNWSFTNTIPDHGHAFGPPTGRGIDTVAGIRNRSWHSSPAGLSFLSFVYPSDRWAAGIFRHQLVRYEMTRRPQGTFFDCSGGFRGDMPPSEPFCEPHAKTDGIDRIFPKDQTIDLNIHSIGSGFAFDWTERLSVGLTVQYFTFEMSAHNQVFSARESKKYEPADYSPANLEIESLQSGTDHAWSANVGFLWDVSERWVVGASFRQGPKFAFRATTVTGPVNLTGSGRIVADEPRNPFRVPDTYAAGVLFRPSAPWRISAEYDLVLFGQLNEDFRDVAQFEGDPEGDLFLRQVRLDDAHQVRVGTEYAVIFRNGTVLAFRGGGWYDPQHQTYFASDPSTGLPAPRWALLFPKGSGTMHWSGGAGIVLGQRLQLDAAADFSDAIDIFSLSAVWRF
jgi:hypothetical protein